MNEYMLSVHTVDGDCQAGTDEERQRSFERILALEEEMKASGAWFFSGRLLEPSSAAVVRSVDGEVLTTDGPFVESKEHLGGFYIIRAKDREAALLWAAKVTEAVGAPIELRALWSAPES